MPEDPQLPGSDKAAAVAGADANRNARGNREAGIKWRCHACGEIHKYWARAERHADENRHHRIEVVL